MKKSSLGLVAGIGLGIAAGVAIGYMNTPKYRYFDRLSVKDAKKMVDQFLNEVMHLDGQDDMVARQIDAIVEEYVMDLPYYQTYVKEMIKQLHQYQVTIQPVKHVKECLYLLKEGVSLAHGLFNGYPLYIDEGRYLMDQLAPSKSDDLQYYRFSEGLYKGCYGLVLSFKVNHTHWYVRLAYIDYGFKVLDFGVMNSRYQSLIN